MTKVIAHRANLWGPSKNENSLDSIEKALSLGFDAEIDVWCVDGLIYLGHDSPDYVVTIEYLLCRKEKLWIHCKNLEALTALSKFSNLNIFWHQSDDFVLTRSNHVWTYPGKPLLSDSISVMPVDLQQAIQERPFAICTDFAIETFAKIENFYSEKR